MTQLVKVTKLKEKIDEIITVIDVDKLITLITLLDLLFENNKLFVSAREITDLSKPWISSSIISLE